MLVALWPEAEPLVLPEVPPVAGQAAPGLKAEFFALM